MSGCMKTMHPMTLDDNPSAAALHRNLFCGLEWIINPAGVKWRLIGETAWPETLAFRSACLHTFSHLFGFLDNPSMQLTLMSGVQCLRAPSTAVLKQSSCSPSFRLSASSLVTNPLRTQQTCRKLKAERGSHTAVRAAVVDSATFYDYSVKV